VSHPDLRCVVSGGPAEGLGHAMRAAALAAEARRRGLGVAFAVAGDAARAAVARELPGVPIEAWTGAAPPAPVARWSVFDTTQPLAAALDAVRKQRGRTLVLDRVDQLEACDLCVLPVAHAAPLSHPRLLQGAEYCVLAPLFRAAPVPDHPGTRDLLLVTLGGADPRGLTPAVCAAAERAGLLAGGLSGHCVVGPAFTGAPGLAQALCERGWSVHSGVSREAMRELMARAQGAVAGFGTTLYELAWMGVPCVFLTHHARDVADAARLEARGFGASAGFGGELEAGPLCALLARTLGDAAWRARASAAGRARLGDGDGAGRILEAMARIEAQA
jgi:spore coat polysaccharide biosynthesis predicted glycosyltransferase SpsG